MSNERATGRRYDGAECSVPDLVNALKHIADDHPCCAGTMSMTVEKLEQMAKLLIEVTDWHSNQKSYEYNECEIEPCHFCSTVALLVHGSEPNPGREGEENRR